MKKQYIVEKEFNFLTKYGYLVKKYIRPPDEEFCYRKDNHFILVSYYLGITPDGKKKMCCTVELENHKGLRNLYHCIDVFPDNLLKMLNKEVELVKPKEQIKIYANFFKENINYVLKLN